MRVIKTRGCWEWGGSIGNVGYGRIHIDNKWVTAHRVSWRLSHGEIGAGLSVLHHCDNRKCVRPSHLFLGTQADNMRDMRSKNRGSPPPPKARVPKNKIVLVKKLLRQGVPKRLIAGRVALCTMTIHRIANGEMWTRKHGE